MVVAAVSSSRKRVVEPELAARGQIVYKKPLSIAIHIHLLPNRGFPLALNATAAKDLAALQKARQGTHRRLERAGHELDLQRVERVLGMSDVLFTNGQPGAVQANKIGRSEQFVFRGLLQHRLQQLRLLVRDCVGPNATTVSRCEMGRCKLNTDKQINNTADTITDRQTSTYHAWLCGPCPTCKRRRPHRPVAAPAWMLRPKCRD